MNATAFRKEKIVARACRQSSPAVVCLLLDVIASTFADTYRGFADFTSADHETGQLQTLHDSDFNLPKAMLRLSECI